MRARGGAYAGDDERRVSEIIEFVDPRDDDCPEDAEKPCPQGVDGHGRVVEVGHG